MLIFCHGVSSIGPNVLTLETRSPANTQIIPTVVDTAFKQGKINKNVIGVYFEPVVSSSNGAGQLTYGKPFGIPHSVHV